MWCDVLTYLSFTFLVLYFNCFVLSPPLPCFKLDISDVTLDLNLFISLTSSWNLALVISLFFSNDELILSKVSLSSFPSFDCCVLLLGLTMIVFDKGVLWFNGCIIGCCCILGTVALINKEFSRPVILSFSRLKSDFICDVRIKFSKYDFTSLNFDSMNSSLFTVFFFIFTLTDCICAKCLLLICSSKYCSLENFFPEQNWQ